MVYKLVDLNGIPRIKLSDEYEKITLPGKKKVLRVYDRAVEDAEPSFDVICLDEEDWIDQLKRVETVKIWEPFKE